MSRTVNALAPYPQRGFAFGVRGGVAKVEVHGEKIVGRWESYGRLLRCDSLPWSLDKVCMLQGTRQKPKTSLIEDFANWPSESLGRFTKDYGPLRDAFSGGDEFEFTCDEWKQAQIDFRRQWETRMLQGQGRRVARIDPYHRLPTLGSEQLVFGWDDELRYEAATIERVLMMELCSQRRGRLRKCGRAGCPNPYFLSNRPLRKYCSDLCANYAQRESKKKWWHNEGAEQRRKKAAKVKKRKSRK